MKDLVTFGRMEGNGRVVGGCGEGGRIFYKEYYW